MTGKELSIEVINLSKDELIEFLEGFDSEQLLGIQIVSSKLIMDRLEKATFECPVCDGMGTPEGEKPCRACDDKGFLWL